jgi:hypothetical protein
MEEEMILKLSGYFSFKIFESPEDMIFGALLYPSPSPSGEGERGVRCFRRGGSRGEFFGQEGLRG